MSNNQRGGAFASSTSTGTGCCTVVEESQVVTSDLLFVQAEEPTSEGPYLWVQTGLGDSGCDFSFWIKS